MLSPGRPSAPPEDTYYDGTIKAVEQSIKVNSKWFRTIDNKFIDLAIDTVRSRMTAKRTISMERINQN